MASTEGMVHAVGVMLGVARDSFGDGGGADTAGTPTSGSSPVLAAAVFDSGQTASASKNQSGGLNFLFAGLSNQDLAAHANLQGALASQGAGRTQMNDVIDGAFGDVTGLGPGSNTNGGMLGLVNALAGRLEQAWQALTTGNTDSSTHAAGSAQVAAGYSALTGVPSGGVAPTGALSSMGGLSSTASAPSGMTAMQVWVPAAAAASTAAASTAAQAATTAQAQQVAAKSTAKPTVQQASLTSATNHIGTQKLDTLDLTEVTDPNVMKRHVAPAGKTQATGYINTALNIMGITDPGQRATWTKGLLWGMQGESSYDPSALNSALSSNPSNPGPMLSDGSRLRNARGILQNIPETFASHHQAGTSHNIYDPVANICSSMWYVHMRYGVDWSGSNLAAKVQAFRVGSSDPGY